MSLFFLSLSFFFFHFYFLFLFFFFFLGATTTSATCTYRGGNKLQSKNVRFRVFAQNPNYGMPS